MVFHFDPKTAKLTPNDPPYYSATPGSGPRNLTFHPNKKWAYSIAEMGSIIECMDWNGDKGTLTRFQVISSLPEGSQISHGRCDGTGSSQRTFSLRIESRRRQYHRLFHRSREWPSYLDPENFLRGRQPAAFCRCAGWQMAGRGQPGHCEYRHPEMRPRNWKARVTGRQYPLDSPVCVVFD